MATGAAPSGTLFPVKGFQLGTAKAGIRYPDRRDLVVMHWPESASVAGVFTQNAFCAAPVHLCRERIPQSPCALLVNTGFANAGTGEQGMADARRTTAVLAETLGCDSNKVLSFSTGVIGELMPVERLEAGISGCVESLSEEGWWQAAEGIMTTDTRPKGFSRQFTFEGETYTVTGIAKGSGMIHPNMATMLTYVATDAAVDRKLLQELQTEIADQSFNRITVDGDTSTNDSSLLIATGQVGNSVVDSREHPLFAPLAEVIKSVSQDLAKSLVMDGEGATRFVTVLVEGAETVEQAHTVANTVALSPLVKTALFACDPNWGRILAAAGRAPVDNLDVSRITIHLDDVLIAEQGGVASSYREEDGQAVMNQEAYTIRIGIGLGSASTQVWTSDLSHEYVTINADYRT
ncbi:bifunctional glutamate N-acetyltransferase/amino-acid acetyltransferase ArgJ [Sansalvadorimonas verongulae]|uniref:bifunctional glutamate N-acetyltransferase/amino-acid acetyltransferase ArgJ n=1 Tax=Sansalvadorimonas verongulae TaxID=2172824 RepID=UPI0012BC68A4|nr:bifunctional glutamate N-acetyltransferase/amino-acid acetyltransferase ArgJ [Sansalvadorimonas verongulae]MTI15233.1 bifunctional glutamate N-acetyltransferase/amino-acid acetyltransferase ArgJ [Sansalvadorimonas verongulae]